MADEATRKIVRLEGRVDTNNAAEVEERVIAEAEGADEVVLDASDLEYISSAGLRMVMRLAKRFGSLSVEEASPEVHEVFEMTGIARILPVARRLRAIDVEGLEEIGRGVNGVVYRVDDDTIVKVYHSFSREDVQRELDYAKEVFVLGVPTAISYDLVRVGEGYGAVYEMAGTRSLAQCIVGEPERFDEWMDDLAGLVRAVGEVDVAGVVPLGKRDLELRKLAKFEGYLEPGEMEALRGSIERIPDSTTLVHGDIHGRNVLVQGDELLLIDMESITHGHHAWDVAHTCFTYWNLSRPMSQEGLCELYLGVPPKTAAAVSRAFLERTFPELGPGELDRAWRGVLAIGGLESGLSRADLVVPFATHEQVMAGGVQALREQFLPYADAIADLVELVERKV